jgi:aryl-alcohol dehydrogenase-like predicted oxidoreductase
MTALALGTANWGVEYGAPGRTALVDRAVAGELGRLFTADGHDLIDTAPAYGDAETLVGEVFSGRARVVTKVGLDRDEETSAEVAVETARRSLQRTRVERFAGLLVHDADAGVRSPSAARRVLDTLRAHGLADRVGVSVYSPDEAFAAVELLGADLLQVPCNVLDQRFVGEPLARLAQLGVEVHVRSAFLNGVLLADPSSLAPQLSALRAPVQRFQDLSGRFGVSPLHAALGFVRDLPHVSAVVVGAFDSRQLSDLLQAWRKPLPAGAGEWSDLAVDDASVDPRSWST